MMIARAALSSKNPALLWRGGGSGGVGVIVPSAVRTRQRRSCGGGGAAARFFASSSSSSSGELLVATEIDASSGIASLTMQRPPVNSMSLEMCEALSRAVKDVERDQSVQGLVLQSSNPAVFSAGLDLVEMSDPDLDRLKEFWTSFQQLYVDLYGTRLATVAAIEGHAPAAGCMLALSCDYRIMAKSEPEEKKKKTITIGLNESQVGIVAPPWLGQMMIDTVGRRCAELSLALGTLYTPEQALDVHLVDRTVPPSDVREAARESAAQFCRIPPAARVASKMLIRKDRLDKMQAARQEDLDHFVGFITNEKTQQSLGQYLAMLAKKASAAKKK